MSTCLVTFVAYEEGDRSYAGINYGRISLRKIHDDIFLQRQFNICLLLEKSKIMNGHHTFTMECLVIY